MFFMASDTLTCEYTSHKDPCAQSACGRNAVLPVQTHQHVEQNPQFKRDTYHPCADHHCIGPRRVTRLCGRDGTVANGVAFFSVFSKEEDIQGGVDTEQSVKNDGCDHPHCERSRESND